MANLQVGAIQTGGMTMTAALTPEQRIAIYDRHRAGESLASIAEDLGIHYETARKWWRVGRHQGRRELGSRPRKRPGLLRDVPRAVVTRICALRREHPDSWGVPFLREKLLEDPELSAEERAKVPSLSTLYRFLREVEDRPPQRPLRNEIPAVPLISQVQYPHQLWQMDLKEKCRVKGLKYQITVANVRDVYSSVTVVADVFQLQRHNATLSGGDVQAACRHAFARFGLPEILRTDQGSCFVGNMPQYGFPSHFTLWLVGLGIVHETIGQGQVTQNGCVERLNRTFNSLVLRDGPFRDLQELQALADATVEFLNTRYPSRAGSCEGNPPLTAHPQAARPRRRYRRDREDKPFSIKRVYKYLASFVWQRRTDVVGKTSLGRTRYNLGRKHARTLFDVTFDPTDQHFEFQTPDRRIIIRRPAGEITADDILNLKPSAQQPLRDHDN